MKKIKQVAVPTGKQCFCGGSIVETFEKKYGESNGIIGPGHHTPSWVTSIGFGCEKCGLSYGSPVFEKTKASEQTIFELSLSIVTIKKKITLRDLGLISAYKEKKMTKKDLKHLPSAIQNLPTTPMTLTPISKKQKQLPLELKNLALGTEVYLLPNDGDPYGMREYYSIILDKKKDIQHYWVARACFE